MPTKFGLAGIGLRGRLEVVKKTFRTDGRTDERTDESSALSASARAGIELRLSCAIRNSTT